MATNELPLIVGDREIAGWDSIRLARGVERMPTTHEY